MAPVLCGSTSKRVNVLKNVSLKAESDAHCNDSVLKMYVFVQFRVSRAALHSLSKLGASICALLMLNGSQQSKPPGHPGHPGSKSIREFVDLPL